MIFLPKAGNFAKRQTASKSAVGFLPPSRKTRTPQAISRYNGYIDREDDFLAFSVSGSRRRSSFPPSSEECVRMLRTHKTRFAPMKVHVRSEAPPEIFTAAAARRFPREPESIIKKSPRLVGSPARVIRAPPALNETPPTLQPQA